MKKLIFIFLLTFISIRLSAQNTAYELPDVIRFHHYDGTLIDFKQMIIDLEIDSNYCTYGTPFCVIYDVNVGADQWMVKDEAQQILAYDSIGFFNEFTLNQDGMEPIWTSERSNYQLALGFTPYNSTNPAGYISSVPAQSFSSLTGKPTTLTGYGITDAYPLSGNPGGFLTSFTEVDGSVTNEIELPAQTGNNGKYLTTNGSAVSWGSLKRQETYSGTTSGSGTFVVTFSSSYSVSPNIQANIIGGTDSQIIKITSVSTSGFTVNVRNRTDVVGLLPSWSNVNGANVDVLITEK